MRIRSFILSAVAAAMCGGVLWAADSEKKEEEPAKQEVVKPVKIPASKAVAKALSEMETFNGTPNYKAKFYIYLQSASWCGPCNEEMPGIVKAYPQMQKQKVELVLIGCDSTEKAAEGFLTKYKATFPGVLSSAPGVSALPGMQKAAGIPHATIVDEKGRVLADGHGSIVKNWESIIKKKPEKKSRH